MKNTGDTRIAVFAGSFDPFTIGHKNIADRALSIFDKVIIGVGRSDTKLSVMTAEERVAAIKDVYSGNDRVAVEAYTGLTVDFAAEHGASALVRGVRNTVDFEAEKTLAEINRRLSGIETVILFTEPGMEFISSSMIRELERYGKPTSDFLPGEGR